MNSFRVRRQRDMQSRGIAADPRPMPLKGEGNSVHDADGCKYTPPGKQTDLPRRQHMLGSWADAVIVKNKMVQHEAILTYGSRVRGHR